MTEAFSLFAFFNVTILIFFLALCQFEQKNSRYFSVGSNLRRQKTTDSKAKKSIRFLDSIGDIGALLLCTAKENTRCVNLSYSVDYSGNGK